MLNRLYMWTLAIAAHPRAEAWLAVIAFLESSVFPIPPDVALAPMVLADRARAWRLAAVTSLASVAGALAGYGIGYFLFEAAGRPILDLYGAMAEFEAFKDLYHDWGVWIVAAGAFTPLPFKVITIASGAVALDPVLFLAAALAARSLRFFAEAALLWYAGPPIRHFVERNLPLAATAFFVALLGGFLALSFWI